MNDSVIIRTECIADNERITQIVREAFANAAHTDGTEWSLVSRLRDTNAYIPELSLVAEIHGIIVGHIMMTRLQIGNANELALAPLSVMPEYQRKGIGSRLVKVAHAEAAKMRFGYSVVLGDDRYYSRFGYRQASEFGILPPFEVESRFFMAKKLSDAAPFNNCIVKYASEFNL